MKNKNFKRIFSVALAAGLVCQLFAAAGTGEAVNAAEQELYYVSAEASEDEDEAASAARAIETAAGVTEEMCRPSYWYDKTGESLLPSDRVLITPKEIEKLNGEMLQAEGANMNDLEALAETYNAKKLRDSLSTGEYFPGKTNIYVNGEKLSDKDAYYEELHKAVLETGYGEETRSNQYAVAVKRTLLSSIPTEDYIGYSATDSDDEKASSALNVNEPFVIRQKATVKGEDFYWGYSVNCTGWIPAENLAICADKEEWLDSWKVDVTGDDFVVVTQNQITLEPSLSQPKLSEVKLTFATILKTVPKEEIPASFGERGAWNNYVVYLPTRKEDGSYEKLPALISQHYELSTGFLPLTQQELIRVSFNNLGDRYGWGGMLDAMDCSAYTRNVYRCFGLEIPRNTSWQQLIPGRKIDLSQMTDEKKLEALKKMPSGALLYFPGHTMIYVGTDLYEAEGEEPCEMAYVISDTGSLSDSTGELEVRSMYSVILNPLTTRRKAGTTWLNNLTAAVLPISEDNFAFVKENVEISGRRKVPAYDGQSYASSKDTLPLDSFLGTSKTMYLSFANVDETTENALYVTALKGARITTKAAVRKVECEKSVASAKIDGANSLATVTLKKSGMIHFTMEDGKTYSVSFTVENPKAETKAVKEQIAAAKAQGTEELLLSPAQLFGTSIDSGELTITSQKTGNAVVTGSTLRLLLTESNTVKVKYRYLDKSYTMSITV